MFEQERLPGTDRFSGALLFAVAFAVAVAFMPGVVEPATVARWGVLAVGAGPQAAHFAIHT